MKTVLIIGKVWLETTSAAGNRLLQLMHQFLDANYNVIFCSTAKKTAYTVSLNKLNVVEVVIELNNTSFDVFIKNTKPDVVLFDRFTTEEQFGWRVAEFSPNSLRILDTEDLHCLRNTRQAQLKNGKTFKVEDLLTSDIAKREIASILRCDLSLIISSFEMGILKNLFKIDQDVLLYLPFLLDILDFEKIGLPSFENRKDFIFLGNFLHQPNVDAIIILQKYWEQIKKQLPATEIHIYGAYAPQKVLQLHNQEVGFLIKGFAENATTVLKNARVLLAPLRFGAGIKGKLTDAMQTGTPSVTTAIGSEGMHASLDWSGKISSLDEFAENAVALYSDKEVWEKAQNNGIEIINKLYNKEVLGNAFLKKIALLKKNLKSHRKTNFLGSLLQHQTLNATKYMSKWIEEKQKS